MGKVQAYLPISKILVHSILGIRSPKRMMILLPFITYLRHSIQRIIPNFGHSFEGWENPSMFPKEEDLNRWLTLFINELCEIGEPYLNSH